MKRVSLFQIAAVASSLTLAGGYVLYRARSSPAVERPTRSMMPGSKAQLIEITDGDDDTYRIDPMRIREDDSRMAIASGSKSGPIAEPRDFEPQQEQPDAGPAPAPPAPTAQAQDLMPSTKDAMMFSPRDFQPPTPGPAPSTHEPMLMWSSKAGHIRLPRSVLPAAGVIEFKPVNVEPATTQEAPQKPQSGAATTTHAAASSNTQPITISSQQREWFTGSTWGPAVELRDVRVQVDERIDQVKR